MKIINNSPLKKEFLQQSLAEELFPNHLKDQLVLVSYQAGENICYQGDDLPFLAVFLQGRLKMVRRLENGKEYILDILYKPNIIGEIELMTKEKAVSSVIALEESYLLMLPLPDREQLIADRDFLYRVGRNMATSLYEQNIQAAANLGYSVKERLATHILTIEKNGQFKLDLNTLADYFATSYRHLHRVLHELLGEGILSKERKVYTILQKEKLKKWSVHY